MPVVLAAALTVLLFSTSAQAVTTTSVTLAWELSSGDTVFGYKIYYGGETLTYTNVVTVGNVAEATIEPLTPGVTYYFTATAIGPDGGESEFSNEVSYTVPMVDSDPLAVRIHSVELWSLEDTASVNVRWNSANEEVSGYYLYYGVESAVYTETRWIDFPPNEHEFAGLGRGVTYYFAVSAVRTDGTEGPLSAEASIEVPPHDLPRIEVQTELLGGGSGNGAKVLLFWADIAAYGYIAYFGTASGEYSSSVVAEPGATEVVIESLVPGRTYYFVVKPIFPDGAEGTASEEVVLTVPLQAGPQATLRKDSEGRLMLEASASPGVVFEVQTSTDLNEWETIWTITAGSSGEIFYEVQVRTAELRRFYRLRWVVP